MSKDYFIEDLRSSSEDEYILRPNRADQTWDPPAQNDSPPAILAFSISSGRGKQRDQGLSCMDVDDGEQEEESSDWSVEEWMILDQEPEEGDSTIQLNLSFSNSSSEEDTDCEDDKNTLLQDSWAISKRDKESGEASSLCRYFVPDQSSICPICKKTGHLAKNCSVQRKSPVCVLCGIHGHFQKECPCRPCSRCGLLAHGARVCRRPPVWYQHCQRCGMMGHLSDICPDTWRQFHHTIKITEVPIRRHTQAIKQRKRPAQCYNCAERGHNGYECHLKRMTSGTFPTLPYVCQYDFMVKAHQYVLRTQNEYMEITNKTQSLAEQEQGFKSYADDEDQFLRRRDKMKLNAQANVRKTWPERRRERQEVKRLRREAQARREGGVLGQCQHKPDGDILYFDPFGVGNPRQHKTSSKKANRMVLENRRSKKNRNAEKWKRRGDKKHSLYPHEEVVMSSENIISLTERVRHRRK